MSQDAQQHAAAKAAAYMAAREYLRECGWSGLLGFRRALRECLLDHLGPRGAYSVVQQEADALAEILIEKERR